MTNRAVDQPVPERLATGLVVGVAYSIGSPICAGVAIAVCARVVSGLDVLDATAELTAVLWSLCLMLTALRWRRLGTAHVMGTIVGTLAGAALINSLVTDFVDRASGG